MDTAKVEVHPDYESLEITPTTETQIKEGSFNKVTVAGDENLKAENISKGTSIFGVEGTANTTSIKITDASYLFYNNSRLNTLNDLLSLCDNITSVKYMFYMCTDLTELELDLDTSNTTTAEYMFNGCRTIKSLDLSKLDMGKLNWINSMFSGMSGLVNLKLFKNLGKGYDMKSQNYSRYKLDLSSATNLTHDSLLDVIDNLYDLNLSYNVANGGTLYRQALVLGSTNLAKLTAEEIAIATNKGWNVS